MGDVTVLFRKDGFTFASQESRFGSKLQDDGYSGILAIADPIDACSPIALSPFNTSAASVALISRHEFNDCDFGIKVSWDCHFMLVDDR